MEKYKHIRCGSLVSFKDVSKGYKAQCPECDEDLYMFEIKEIKK